MVETLIGDFFYLSMEPSAVMEADGTFLKVNPAWGELVGLPPEAMAGTSILDYCWPEDGALVNDALHRIERGESVTGIRSRFKAAGETQRWLEWMAQPVPGGERLLAVFRDVTKMHNTEVNLRIARDAAERASRAKSEFLSRMSHELRTPLNSIIGFGQLLEMDDLPPDQAEPVAFILKSGRHLLDLINDVLDISRIESGNMRMSVEPVVLAERIRLALDLIRPIADERNIRLSCVCPRESLLVSADHQRLLQVLLNLLSNAVKYSCAGDEVTVEIETSGGTVTIAVIDTGPGISESDQAKLFDPFERLGAEATEIEGTGVGLPLSRALSQEMGGALTVSSEPGVGSTFCLELRQAEAGDGDVGDDNADNSDKLVRGHGNDVGHTGLVPVSEVMVLCIEDNIANIELVEAALRKLEGVRFLAATQGRIGLEMAGSVRPDLILLDLHLPDMSGEEVLRKIRSDSDLSDCQVVICTADEAGTSVPDLEAEGADGILFKPIELAGLFDFVEAARPEV